MKLGLINSAWAQAGKGAAWGIRQTNAVGFDTIEWVSEAYAATDRLMREAGIAR